MRDCVLFCTIPPSSFLLSYSYLSPRDLHSFPTRRSSDLRSNRRHRQAGGCDVQVRSDCGPAPARGSRRLPHQARRSSSRRSEEHTSELQSRGHLVCRLLLEKKKKSTPLLSLRDK